MPDASRNHDAHGHAERIRVRLPRRLQELREAAGMSKRFWPVLLTLTSIRFVLAFVG